VIATSRADDRVGVLATLFVAGYAAELLPVLGLEIALQYQDHSAGRSELHEARWCNRDHLHRRDASGSSLASAAQLPAVLVVVIAAIGDDPHAARADRYATPRSCS
jgi:hypothetical protein